MTRRRQKSRRKSEVPVCEFVVSSHQIVSFEIGVSPKTYAGTVQCVCIALLSKYKTHLGAAISAQLVTQKQLCRSKRPWTFYLTWTI